MSEGVIDREGVLSTVAYQTEGEIDPTGVEWTTRVGDSDVFHFDYESEPLFGSPTQYCGYISSKEFGLIIGTHHGKPQSVARRVIESKPPKRANLSASQQHQLVSMNEGAVIIEANHPDFRPELIEDMCLNALGQRDVDDLRTEIRDETHAIVKAHLKYKNQTVKVFFDGFNARPPATANAFSWFTELLNSAVCPDCSLQADIEQNDGGRNGQ